MRSELKGALAGLAGGLAASAIMSIFQQAMSAATQLESQPEQPESEDATMKTAEALSETVAGTTLTKEQKRTGGTLVHYAFGGAMGALYGALAEVAPQTTIGHGTPYGAAVWLGADEIAVPAFGLADGPAETPASTHLQALAAHLVYGVTLDTVRRLVRRVL